ncbi:MAG: asparagine synthase (glutamine-hydrolyzing) [Desulfobacter sp.]|nr:MAG: asparagine synthase (glutamine-hydrolyzing) [Desulfobacter sp.]
MCGIAGILDLTQGVADEVILTRMTRTLAHRGPDGQGIFTDGGLGLGHRRLAVIDLSPAGAQPMSDSNGRYTIAYNGEVYNYLELRRELETLGRTFRSQTDTEVLLQAYAQWGQDCVGRFNGMFALAIWDAVDKTLFLARDRYGIKPLYYTFFKGKLLFASEQKAILQYPGFQRKVDLEALVEYFTFQNIFTDRTLMRGIHMFPPGSCCLVGREASPGGPLQFLRFWDYHFREPEKPLSKNQYVEHLNHLLSQAVKRQLRSDTELGAYLSGGMDSGSITAIAARELPYIKSFTCGFDLNSASGMELAFDERQLAEYMSYRFGTEHYEMVLKAGDMERIMPELVCHVEEPRVGQCYPNYYVARLAGKFVKVVLAGTGADELFAGYPWRYYRAARNGDFESYVDKYYRYWQRLIPNRSIHKVFQPVWKDVSHVWTRDIFHDVFNGCDKPPKSPEDYINYSLYFEAKTFLHGLLVIEDKMSMAHGLETRVPFLDNDLVDFAMQIPVGMKLGNLSEVIRLNENEPGNKTKKYFNKTRDGKLILREAASEFLPERITRNIKQGFSAPDASWFKGESMDYVKAVVFNSRAAIYEFLDRKTVQDLVTEHLNGKVNRRLLIWSLLNVEGFLRTFIDTSFEPVGNLDA